MWPEVQALQGLHNSSQSSSVCSVFQGLFCVDGSLARQLALCPLPCTKTTPVLVWGNRSEVQLMSLSSKHLAKHGDERNSCSDHLYIMAMHSEVFQQLYTPLIFEQLVCMYI